jgi:signal transduction histidine kinase
MALRLNSLMTRTAVAIASVIVVILTVNAIYLVVAKRRELRQDIEDRAMLFARLTHQPICVTYETYYASGYYKFRERMRDYLELEDTIERISIINVNGVVLFDSDTIDAMEMPRPGAEPRVQDLQVLEAVRRLEPTEIPMPGPDGEPGLEVVAPFVEDWGRHRLSVSYRVSYRTLKPRIAALIHATLGLTLVSMVPAILMAVALARRITRPLEELTTGAQALADGHFDRRLTIRSNDEIEILARAFNHMTERLRQNVEQLEESNRKLAALNEELKVLDRLKSDLLANVSHELRTPLTAIKGYTDYIREGKLGQITEKQEKGLLVVQKNLDRLAKSINDLLDFSRMDVGRIALNIQPFDIGLLVEQIRVTVSSELERKGVAFLAQVEAGLPPVIADREKLSQVLENLVINAIKFTAETGHIRLSARRLADAARPTAMVQVEDDGIGIPSDQVDKIFSRFHQVDGSSKRRFGGVGLGLAIVKSILDAHGSEISVTSREGVGTRFSFPLPLLDKGDSPQPREKRLDGPRGAGDLDRVTAV